MRKLILSLVFVLGTGTFINANSSVLKNEVGTCTYTIYTTVVVGGISYTDATTYTTYASSWSDCNSQATRHAQIAAQ